MSFCKVPLALQEYKAILAAYRRSALTNKSSFLVDGKWYASIWFSFFFFQDLAQCEDLVDRELTRSKAALIRSYDQLVMQSKPFTQYACENGKNT